ncbi:lectin like domain-containing protein [Methanogenium organophilum]|uniref:Lectin like domain-containing protein n=1 Tax=Methanogenium organophilum TaxID=2199 RepID=A0A9X9T8L3_METOG|nr:lectin like domain-containing protein [Methanogenium organophilum]WAI02274.1 lectin like domain-containing protein [Methanogenium organophilum]
MPPIPSIQTTVLFILALLLVQGAAALSIEQAPLNPAFVAYLEGQDAGDTWYATGCLGSAGSTTGTPVMPYATGDIPAPVVMSWPDADSIDIYQATATDEVTFPARFDLRDEDRVTPVRDQGDCGSCWTFAAYGSLESTYLTDTGMVENFSENNMKNLCSDLYPDGFDGGPCSGGNAFMSAAYLTRGSGPVREEDDPYILPVPSNISPTNLPPVLDTYEVTFLPTRTDPLENDLFKQTLMDEGGIRVRFLVNYSCFSGNGTTYYRPDAGYPSVGGHAVTLVGWDDAFPKEEFVVTPPGDGAFILKNSWGTGFGEDGYFYISYYDRSLDTSESAVFTGVAADDERQTYQYDPLGWTTSIGTGTSAPICGANIFTADRYEALTDVSFYTREPETHYAVAIYTNFTIAPGDRPPVTWTTGTCSLPGFHTISLPESVPLMPGEVFSVILEVVSPTDTSPLVVEMPIEGYSSGATAEAGESYVSTDGSWEDLTTHYPDTNVCIKAHTSPLTVVPRDYPTVQEAVNASAAGDTIIVEAGTYPEELILDKPLTLLGVGTPVLATPADGIGAEIEAENITIAGFTFDGGGAAEGGIGITGDDCTMYDMAITGYEQGLYIGFVNNLSLSDTAVYDNDYNLIYEDFLDDPGNTIAETVTVNGRPVIYREGAAGETIDGSSDAGVVICVNCTNMSIRDTATATSREGYVLFGCRDVTMQNVTADAVRYGMVAEESANISVQDSSFGPDVHYGVVCDAISGLQMDKTDIACAGNAGIELMDATDCTITDSAISGGRIGVLGFLLENCSFTGNTIVDSDLMGFGTLLGDGLIITNNTVETSFAGIYAEGLFNTLVSGNSMQCKDTGTAILVLADGTEISANIAENCSIQALMELNDSVVYGNRFSGGAYPIIEAPDGGAASYVFRNDFVLTEIVPDGDILSATAAAEMPAAGAMDAAAVFSASGCSIEDVLPADWRPTGRFSTMTAAADVTATADEMAASNVTWHSPGNETYWYYGQEFTRTMGNYWSTYTGVDTTHDGIGETPFVYDNETIDSYPLVNPSAQYLDERPTSPDDEDPSANMATSHALSAGDSATLTFSGSAVQTVTVTAADSTGRILLTVDPAHNGPDGLTGPVYQYLSAQLSGMTDDDVREAVFSFRVPAAWLRAEGLAPADMALWRFHDDVWQQLPTSVLREEGGWIYFEAISPGFSSFAIAGGADENLVIETNTPETGGETADVGITVTTKPGNETVTEPEPQITVAVPEGTDTAAEEATAPQKSPIGLLPAIAGAGACAAVLFRRR